MLTVVIGPPAGGKSTWVAEHAQPGDIVIDFDRLAVALSGPDADLHDHPPQLMAVTRAARTAAIEAAVKQAKTVDVYLIHSSPGVARMAEYHALGAQIVTVDPGRDVVRQRCKNERPARMFAVIDEWYRQHRGGQTEADGSSVMAAPAWSFPSVTSRDW